MNPARIAPGDRKSLKCYGLWGALSSQRVQWPPIFFVFNIILFFSTYSQSFKKICTWELLGMSFSKMKQRQQTMMPFLSTAVQSQRQTGNNNFRN